MPVSLRPNMRVDSVARLSADFLRARGISLLLLDLDNTLVPCTEKGRKRAPEKALLAWKTRLNRAGIRLFLVSNTKKPRAGEFAAAFGVGYVMGARKPSPAGIREALARCGKTPAQSALVGDQIFTDVLGANRAGVRSILVRPLSLRNPLMFLRYLAETPFRVTRRKTDVKQ